jgi:hypothetical protein
VRDALKSLGEAGNTNFNGECVAGGGGKHGGTTPAAFSHTASGLHPEVVLRADSL